jgi:hypothetical protein
MLTELYANNASTTLTTNVNPSDTTILVASAIGFPVPGANQFFKVTIDSGTAIEIVYVFGVSGNTFINCLRGQENTVASTFQAGTLLECRLTAGSINQFARYQDRLAPISSVDALSPPNASDGNSYICSSLDDGGSPVVAINKGTTSWRFLNYPTVALSGTALASSTTTKVNFSNASVHVPLPFSGKYIIQFTSGLNQGLARAVTNSDSSGIYWSTALPNAPFAGDAFEVYQSTNSSISSLIQSASDGLIFAILFSD